MRNHLRILTICLVLMTFIVAIPLAQDDPNVTITPDVGAVGTATFEIAINGLVADEAYIVEFVFDGVVIYDTDEVADENGEISFLAASNETDSVGVYTVQVIRNDSIVTSTTFELTEGDSTPPEETTPVAVVGSIDISPDSGPVSTLHTISLSDLEPDTSYTVEITATRTEEVVYRRVWTSDEQGIISIEIFAEAGDTTGQQVVSVFDEDGNLVAQDEFTIEDEPIRDLTIDVSPTVAQAGREFTFTIEGLVAFDNVTLQIVSETNVLIDTVQARASSEGIAILSFLSPDDMEDGIYHVSILVDGSQLSQTELQIGDAPVVDDNNEAVVSDATLTVEPEAAPIGGRHVMSISGLQPDQAFTLIIMDGAGEVAYSKTDTADESGEFSINISSSEGDELGTYPVEVTDPTTGQVIASAQMIITDGDAPELTGEDTTAQVGTPVITVDPESGEIGTTHIITLSGMPAGQRIGVVVRAQADDTLALSSVVRVNDNGDGTLEFTSRDLNTPGAYDVTAVQASGDLASTTLTIEGALASIDPQSGVLGSTHVVTVIGLNPDETVTIDVSYDGEVVYSTERTADANGETSLNLSTDETDEAGDYTITVVRESGNQPSAILTATDGETTDDTTTNTVDESALVSTDAEVIEASLEDGIAEIEFEGEEGQFVIITVESDEFDTQATVYDEDFFEIAYNDDGASGTNSQIGPLHLPYSGTYTLQVMQSFYMSEEIDVADFVATIKPITISPISFNEPMTFELSPESSAVYYELPVNSGDSINVTIDSDGTLDTVLQVLYPDGFEFAFDDDGGTGFDAELNNVIFTVQDNYILVVSSFVENSTGAGTLTVTRNAVKSLDDGDITVTLNNKSYTDLAVFDAEEGEVITLNLEKLSGQVDDLYVYANVDGMQIMSYSTMGVPDNLPLTFVMPMSGQVVVTFEELSYGGGISLNVSLEKE